MSKRWKVALLGDGLHPWWKRRSGRSSPTLQHVGNGTLDLERLTLDRKLPLALLPPDATPLVPDPLPDTLLPEPKPEVATPARDLGVPVLGPTVDASALPEKQAAEKKIEPSL